MLSNGIFSIYIFDRKEMCLVIKKIMRKNYGAKNEYLMN